MGTLQNATAFITDADNFGGFVFWTSVQIVTNESSHTSMDSTAQSYQIEKFQKFQ